MNRRTRCMMVAAMLLGIFLVIGCEALPMMSLPAARPTIEQHIYTANGTNSAAGQGANRRGEAATTVEPTGDRGPLPGRAPTPTTCPARKEDAMPTAKPVTNWLLWPSQK